MAGVRVNQGGTVKPVTGIRVNVGGVVKTVLEAYVNQGGVVKKFWPDIGAPNAISDLRVTTSAANSVSLAWTAAVANGSPVTGYEISYGTDGVTFPSTKTVGVVTSDTVSGLAATTAYFFRIRANSALGYSGYSNIAQGTTQPATYPQAPTLAGIGNGIYALNWQVTAGGGGTPQFYDWEYALYPYTNFVVGGTIAYTGSPQTFSQTLELHAQGCAVRVKARNAAGSSVFSSIAVQVTAGPIVNNGTLYPQVDEADVGTFKDIVYAINDPGNGGSGQVVGSCSPTVVSGYTIERLGRPGQNVFAIALIGANLPQSLFTRLTAGRGNYPFTLDANAATFTQGGTQGTIFRWTWSNIPTEFISEVLAGNSVPFSIG